MPVLLDLWACAPFVPASHLLPMRSDRSGHARRGSAVERDLRRCAQHIQRHMLTNELRFRVNYELVTSLCVFIAMRVSALVDGGSATRHSSIEGCGVSLDVAGR